MFIKKKKLEQERSMPSESFRSFKTSVTYKKIFFDFMPDKCVNCEAAFVGHISSFCVTLSDIRC